MKKILVTGSRGFVGTHVLNLLRLQPDVNIFAPRSSHLDLLNSSKVFELINDYEPDCILHMAAKCGGILANQNSPADFLHDNTQMALTIYKAAQLHGVKNVYSLGSVCSYPKFCPVPFKEETIWDGPAEETNFPYGQAKRTLLMLSQTYRQQYGFTGAHLIPVNMYGEHDHFDLTNSHVIPALINKFVDAVSKNKRIVECWGTGEATREFLYAGDAAEAIVKAVTTGFDSALPINLGTGQDIKIKDLAIMIADLCGYKEQIAFNGTVSDGQPKRMLDVSRAKELLGWTANTNLRDGLKKTIEWYNNDDFHNACNI